MNDWYPCWLQEKRVSGSSFSRSDTPDALLISDLRLESHTKPCVVWQIICTSSLKVLLLRKDGAYSDWEFWWANSRFNFFSSSGACKLFEPTKEFSVFLCTQYLLNLSSMFHCSPRPLSFHHRKPRQREWPSDGDTPPCLRTSRGRCCILCNANRPSQTFPSQTTAHSDVPVCGSNTSPYSGNFCGSVCTQTAP